nr:adenosylmethionine--8-amino-7-oxononanoate transaminase [uncultured Dongia sp.]
MPESVGGTPAWLRDGFQHLWLPYAQMQTAPMPLAVVRAEGARLHLADGTSLIDGIASWWTQAHGYNHPHIRQAVATQLEKLPHVMLGGLANEPAMTLAARLAKLLPGDLDHVFFCESGSVSVEVAMKMAIQYWINRGVTGRTRFVSFRHGYHGDTMACMSICDPDEGMHGHFKGYLPEQIVADLPRDAAGEAAFIKLLAERGAEIAGIIVEPLVQGAGGMKFHDASVLQFLRRITEAKGHLLILDEIMTGFGRLGTMFACEQAGVVPDIITLSKALSGGTLPLSAAIARRHVYQAFLSERHETALMHGPTYMGNPLACAAANASLDLFEREPRLAQISAIVTHLQENLETCRGLKGVVDVRVKGAIGVVQLDRPGEGAWLRPHFLKRGVWIRPFGDIVYLAPPFIVSEAELAQLTGAVVEAVTLWSRERA